MRKYISRFIGVAIVLLIAFIGSYKTLEIEANKNDDSQIAIDHINTPAGEVLATIEIKGRAAKTGYSRDQFGPGWQTERGCDTRNQILARDLKHVVYQPTLEPVVCVVDRGVLTDPFSGKDIVFTRGPDTSSAVQIDHVVALSDAWQKGAQQLTYEQRVSFANDQLVLLAVDGGLNQQKGDGDAATWLPPNKSFRCDYVARQVAIKKKYSLWMTRSEYDVIANIIKTCPEQRLPS